VGESLNAAFSTLKTRSISNVTFAAEGEVIVVELDYELDDKAIIAG